MGSSQAKFDERTIRDFEETTPFNRAEIAHTFGHFVELYELYQNSPECDHDRPHHIRTGRGFANPDCELPVEFIANNFTKLHCNPFRTRICNAFCTSDSGWMCFTEFVDMVSSFSPKADLEKKIFHAFQIFDFNGDGLLKRDDLYKMIDLMTHNNPDESEEDQEQWQMTKEWIVDGIFRDCNKSNKECNLDPDGGMMGDPDTMSMATVQTNMQEELMLKSKEALTIEDFRYCVYRSPDFRHTFSFNI